MRLLFADDLQIYVSFPISELPQAIQLLQAEIESLANWCLTNSLTINPKKTQAIFFGHKMLTEKAYQEFHVIPSKIGNISVVDTVRNLGVIMDSSLSWVPQVNRIARKIRSVLYRLRRMSPFTDIPLRKTLVSTLIFPIFDYCAAIYGDLSGRLDSKLQVLLNSCVRYVFQLSWREHITPYRLQLQWLSARNRRLYLSTRLLHKILTTSAPGYLKNLISLNVPRYTPRRVGPQISVPFTSSQQLRDSFSIHSSYFWNSLPASLRLSPTVNSFKYNLRSFLLQSESLHINTTQTP